MTSVQRELGRSIALAEVREVVSRSAADVFALALRPIDLRELEPAIVVPLERDG
jgi:hypothetical protein